MGRAVENDDFCQFMTSGETPFEENAPWTMTLCTHFDVQNDECDLAECAFSIKWLKWFEYMEARD